MGVCRTLGTSLILAAVALLVGARPAVAQSGDAEALAQAAISDMQSLIEACEQDAAELKNDCAEKFTDLADRLPEEKATRKIEKLGAKYFKKFGKLRSKVEKRVDKVAVKAAKRIAKLGGDPALIEQLDQQRTALHTEANLMLDDVWGEIAEIQQGVIDGLGGQ